MRVIIQLKSIIVNPGDGSESKLVCADWETINDENYVAVTPFGRVFIPRPNVDYAFIPNDDIDAGSLSESVWTLN